MERQKLTREFKVKAVRPIRDRGVSSAAASHDLGVHETVLRHCDTGMNVFGADSEPSLSGHGETEAEQRSRLKREVTKFKSEWEILKAPRLTSGRLRRAGDGGSLLLRLSSRGGATIRRAFQPTSEET